MTDNVDVTSGSGTTIATDNIGGVNYQRVKVVWGADGTATDADTASGGPLPAQIRSSTGTELATSSNPIRIDPTGTTAQPITDNGGSLTVDGTIATNADGTTGSAVPAKGLLVQGSDGTNARNISTTTSGVIKVDLSATAANTTAVKVDGSAVTQPVSGTVGTNADGTSGSAVPSKGFLVQGSDGTNSRNLSTTTGGVLKIDLSSTAANATAVKVDGSAATQPVSQSGTWTVQPGNTANTTAWLVTQTPATSGGLSIYRLLSAASTNGNNIKGSAGQVYGWAITNTNASARFVKLYNKATSPTVGTDTPVITLTIPGATAGAGMVFHTPSGIAFGTGISIAVTGAVTDADTTAISANEVVVNLFYK